VLLKGARLLLHVGSKFVVLSKRQGAGQGWLSDKCPLLEMSGGGGCIVSTLGDDQGWRSMECPPLEMAEGGQMMAAEGLEEVPWQ